jgi:SAM-dependent methyltransferase
MNCRKNELYYEQLKEKFDLYMSSYDVQQRLKLIKNSLPNNIDYSNVLEVGCGTGKITKAFKKSRKLTVSDISAKLAQSVSKKFNCKWSQQNACDMSFPNNNFSFIFSSECIEHTPSPEKSLKEMARVLKPGGVLLVTSPNILWYPIVWLSMSINLRKFKGNEIFLSPFKAKNILKKSNCTILYTSGCHLFPWQIPLMNKLLPFFDLFGRILYPIMINYCIVAKKNKVIQKLKKNNCNTSSL